MVVYILRPLARVPLAKKNDCTQLKVCVWVQNRPAATVPMGLFLLRQIDYGVYCIIPKDNY